MSVKGYTGRNDVNDEKTEVKYLTFWMEGQLFGIPIGDVVQIIRMENITVIPEFPSYAKGVINLRGDIVPVIDIQLRFKKPAVSYTDHTCIIVTMIREKYVGFIVEAVVDVPDISKKAISEPPTIAGDTAGKYMVGVARLEKELVLLLETSRLLEEKELEALEEAARNRMGE